LRKGNLKFRLNGDKLKGGFALVKIKGRGRPRLREAWLLIKEKDEFVRPGLRTSTAARPESVATGRTLEQIAADRDRIWDSGVGEVKVEKTAKRRRRLSPEASRESASGGQRGPFATTRRAQGSLPAAPQAQLATAVTDPPRATSGLHEMKFDGYRILSGLEKGRVRLVAAMARTGPIASPR